MKQLINTIDKMTALFSRQAAARPWLVIGSAIFIMASAYLFNRPHQNHVIPIHLAPPTNLRLLKSPKLLLLDWRTIVVKKNDTLSEILLPFKLGYAQTQTLLALPLAEALHNLRAGKTLRIAMDDHHKLIQLQYPINQTKTLVITRNENGFQAHTVSQPLESRLEYIGATIHSNLFNAAHHASLSKRLVLQLAKIFVWDVNFTRQIRPGDKFAVLYESFYAKGKKIRNGNIVAATLVNQGKTYAAIRYTDKNGNAAYYTPKGKNLKKTILRRPIHHSHISSRFSLHRWHPLLHRFRSHYGVDYAAPWGTPILAAGEGHIVAIGHGGGYGNYIKIKHNRTYTTVYGHMSRFAKHMHHGLIVHKGDIIGYVGSTGLATGPHLHYEIRVHNHPRNPLTVAIPRAYSVAKKHLAAFKIKAKRLLHRLHSFQHTHLASNN